jgi:hypothetical protein
MDQPPERPIVAWIPALLGLLVGAAAAFYLLL